MSCSEAESQGRWAHADVQLEESVFICLHSRSGRTFQQDVVLQDLKFGSINFSTNVNQNLAFQMKRGNQSLSAQSAESLKKDRQINNVQKCNPASRKTYCIMS